MQRARLRQPSPAAVTASYISASCRLLTRYIRRARRGQLSAAAVYISASCRSLTHYIRRTRLGQPPDIMSPSYRLLTPYTRRARPYQPPHAAVTAVYVSASCGLLTVYMRHARLGQRPAAVTIVQTVEYLQPMYVVRDLVSGLLL
jgi:hypothetical protein